MTWENIKEKYRQFLILENKFSRNSLSAYMDDLKKLENYCLSLSPQIIEPNEITYNDLKGFIGYILSKKYEKSSHYRILSGVRAFFRYMVYASIIDENPTKLLELPKLDDRLPEVLTVEEIELILLGIDLSKDEGQRNKAIIETLYSCGLRVSELINLRLSYVNFRKDFIRVTGKGNKERLVPIGQTAQKEIKLYIKYYRNKLNISKQHEDILFLNRRGNALSRMMIFYIIKDAAANAGIEKNVSPHTFRHSFASHLVNRGADLRAVQEMLGHESIVTTEIYTHLDDSYLRDTLTLFHPRSKIARNEYKK